MTSPTNRQVLLAERPDGALAERHFRAVDGAVPEPGDGEVLCRTVLISIDPANRAWMQARTYRPRLEAGQVMGGYAISQVVDGNGTQLSAGDLVLGDTGWQAYAAAPAAALHRIEPRGPLSHHLGVLGTTGLTAYFGVRDIARPSAGETFVVSAAAGGTGSVAGQLARIAGARVVGVTGSDAKNRRLVDELGFAATANHRSPDLRRELRDVCADGIDIYFDNVGGAVLETALTLMRVRGRIVCCGSVSQYDAASPPPGPRGVPGLLSVRRLRMEGFLVLDHAERWPEAEQELAALIAAGELVVLEDISDGLETAPAALVGLLAGDNVGKRIVRVAPDP